MNRPTPSPSASSAPQVRPILAMLALMLVLAALDQTLLSTALPTLAAEFKDTARLSWVFSTYLIASTVVIPLYGKLADLHGSRPCMLTAVALFAGGSLACAMAGDLTDLLLARGLQGAGGGGLMTMAMLSAAELVPVDRRRRLQGLLGATYAGATLLGPLVGGLIVQHATWRWTFWINLPLALIALAQLWRLLPRRAQPRDGEIDLLGALLLSAALVALLLATRRDVGSLGLSTLALGVIALKLSAAFLWRQHRAAHPLLPLGLFRHPAFARITLLSALTGAMLFATVVFLPMYFQTALGMSPTTSALHTMPMMLGLTVGAILAGRWMRRHARFRSLGLAGGGLLALSFAALTACLWHAPSSAWWIASTLAPLGLGLGCLMPLLSAVSQQSAPPQHLGVATANPLMMRALGGAVGASLLGLLFSHTIALQMGATAGASLAGRAPSAARGLPHELVVSAMSQAAAWVYGVAALLALIALAVAAGLPRHATASKP